MLVSEKANFVQQEHIMVCTWDEASSDLGT